MLVTERTLHCVNPDCPHPENPKNNLVCGACQTPLMRRYVIAISESAAKYGVGELIAQRYKAIAPHIWLDTQPGVMPQMPAQINASILPYLQLYPYRLHLPQVYGVVLDRDDEIVLLENAPLDEEGKVYPALATAWESATGVRQVYWLWQILELWQPLLNMGVAASLLNPENLRVQGWCVRLIQLNGERTPTLKDLGNVWERWVANAHPGVAEGLRNVLGMLRGENTNLAEIFPYLNRLLLSAAGELPLKLDVMGATDPGAELLQNEDGCFPTNKDVIDDPLLPRVAIVCDGIGGHEGGEVASQMALQSIKLQLHALFAEAIANGEIVPPDIFQKQLAAALRIVNNLICGANNSQQRQGQQRMGTTMAIAVQLPQKVSTVMGWEGENSHEVYIATVGDSRAYLITGDGCQLLTLDDDVSVREVSYGRSLYRKALQRTDATCLTQALGAKDGEYLHPRIQRLIIDEDAILLLCSDGLSDNLLVERTWQDFAGAILADRLSLEEGLYGWLKCALAENGHDNISLVLTRYRVTTPETINVPVVPISESQPKALDDRDNQLANQDGGETDASTTDSDPDGYFISAEELLNLEHTAEEQSTSTSNSVAATGKKAKSRLHPFIIGAIFLILFVSATGIGLFAWWKYAPGSFQRTCQRLPATWEEAICPK